MKQLSILIVLIFVSCLPSISQTSPIADRLQEFEYLSAPDSSGLRMNLKMPSRNANKIKLPYPIIFIHGLNSNSTTWSNFTKKLDDQFDFTYGGRLDYCLNFDMQNNTSNTQFGLMAGGKDDISTFAATLIPGDYYFINFDVGADGSFHPNGSSMDVLSNQSAVAKQGVALKHAIQQVLQVTGREKVILMGHSMGGLASREYLQNPSLWQPDGQHHVAKLVTTGTPHGGSNTTSYGMGIGGINEQSEAVRDLRSSYYYSKDKGVYLWGGNEIQNATTMNDNIHGFFNVDVNCNEQTSEWINGLNEKELPLELDYASITGLCTGCVISSETGDGIVSAANAELKAIYPGVDVHQFYYSAYAATEIHTALPGQLIQNMQGLDEPNALNLAYQVEFDKRYTAFSTLQAVSSAIDNDAFTFEVTSAIAWSLHVDKTDVSDLIVDLYDADYNKVFATYHSKGMTTIKLKEFLQAGTYYLVFSNIPGSSSYLYPYTFILNSTIDVGVDVVNKNVVELFPNPAENTLHLHTENYNSKDGKIEIINSIGEVILRLPFTTSTDVSSLACGVYFVKLMQANQPTQYLKFVKR